MTFFRKLPEVFKFQDCIRTFTLSDFFSVIQSKRKNEEQLLTQAEMISTLTSENISLQAFVETAQDAQQELKREQADEIADQCEEKEGLKLDIQSLQSLLKEPMKTLDKKIISWRAEEQLMKNEIRDLGAKVDNLVREKQVILGDCDERVSSLKELHAKEVSALKAELQTLKKDNQKILALAHKTRGFLASKITKSNHQLAGPTVEMRFLVDSSTYKAESDQLEAEQKNLEINEDEETQENLSYFPQEGFLNQEQSNTIEGKRAIPHIAAITACLLGVTQDKP